MQKEAGNHSTALTSFKRLKKELITMSTNPPPLCSAGLKENDLYEWTAILMGPLGSPYEGGTFKLNMKFCKQYPFQPPKVCFATRIYHCNVDESGHICLDILDMEWSPSMTVPTLLLSILSLMTDPNPDSPLRYHIAVLYKKNRTEHDLEAMEWTLRYAAPK